MAVKFRSVPGREVFQWPEFKALCKRLNVALDSPTTEVTISVPFDGPVRIDHQYLGRDAEVTDEKTV